MEHVLAGTFWRTNLILSECGGVEILSEPVTLAALTYLVLLSGNHVGAVLPFIVAGVVIEVREDSLTDSYPPYVQMP